MKKQLAKNYYISLKKTVGFLGLVCLVVQKKYVTAFTKADICQGNNSQA